MVAWHTVLGRSDTVHDPKHVLKQNGLPLRWSHWVRLEILRIPHKIWPILTHFTPFYAILKLGVDVTIPTVESYLLLRRFVRNPCLGVKPQWSNWTMWSPEGPTKTIWTDFQHFGQPPLTPKQPWCFGSLTHRPWSKWHRARPKTRPRIKRPAATMVPLAALKLP